MLVSGQLAASIAGLRSCQNTAAVYFGSRVAGRALSTASVLPRQPTDDDIRDVQQELDSFFGAQHIPAREPARFAPIDSFVDRGAVPERNGALLGALPASQETPSLTHVDEHGELHMVDVGKKRSSVRTARASALVHVGAKAFDLVRRNQMQKGDVLSTAQVAGIMGAKQTSNLIPLCHNLVISKADVRLELDEERHAIVVRTLVKCVGQTGVEMEALTAASVAALTVYDMCKAVTKDLVISGLCLDHKSGGASGDYQRQDG